MGWLELFFDLIFVAAIIQLGDALVGAVAAQGALTALLVFALHFAPLWIVWIGFSFFSNRFDVDDFIHRLLTFLMMACTGALAVFAPIAMDAEHPIVGPFSLAAASAHAVVALLYLRAWKHTPSARAYSVYWGSVFAAGAAFWALGAVLPLPWAWVAWVGGLVAVLASPAMPASRELQQRFPLDQEHLSERFGLLTIIVLGESFVKVASYLSHGHALEPDYLAKGGFNLVLTLCIWWIYFDDVAGSRIKSGRFTWLVWLYGHFPLTLAVTATAVALKSSVAMDLSAPAPVNARWLLCSTLALTFVAVALIDNVTERRQALLDDRWRVRVRVLSALVLCLLGATGSRMPAWAFLTVVTLIGMAQVAFDMLSAPMEEAGLEATTSTAEIHRQRSDSTEPTPQRVLRDVSEAVRRGAPPALRNDLYAFLMEGSWAGLSAVLAFGFLSANVVFACLYLLVPGGLGGAQNLTFMEAFAFSVQTFATIGYGSLYPNSAGAHAIVTVEAAIGLLSVALATGLMLAKASRPRASVIFSKPMVMHPMDGELVLSLRVGNARGNDVVDASVTLTALVDQATAEGQHLRRMVQLPLVRDRSPLFSLSWSVMHKVDAQSPIGLLLKPDPSRELLGIVVTLMGHDSTYGQMVYARQMYPTDVIRQGHRFVDVMSELDDGRLMVDYGLFHDTVPIDAPVPDVGVTPAGHGA